MTTNLHGRPAENTISRQLRIKDLEQIPDPCLTADELTPEEIVGAERWGEMSELERRQLSNELEDWLSGMYCRRAQNDKAISRGNQATLAPVRQLTHEWIKALANAINEERDACCSGKGKRRGARAGWLRACETLEGYHLADIVIRALVSSLTDGVRSAKSYATITDVCIRIGRNVDVDRRMTAWANNQPGLHRSYEDGLKKAGVTRKHKRKVMEHGFNQKFIPSLPEGTEKEELASWDGSRCGQIGLGLLVMALRVTGGCIEQGQLPHANRKGHWKTPTTVLMLTDEARTWIATALRKREIECRRPRPMICPPLPWTSRTGGGYLLGTITTRGVLTRTDGRARRTWEMLKDRPPPTRVYEALNYLGNTKLRVRKSLLEVALEARNNEIDLPDIPLTRPRIPEPVKPTDIATNEKARKDYRFARSRVIEKNLKLVSKELANEDALTEAHLFADELALYFPHACDFRGRMYPIPPGLQAQGSDLRRALLEFAEGKPISFKDKSADWLAIQVAKTFGEDKQTFDDRIRWVFDHEQLIRRIADDPLGNRQEWEARADKKKLWQCLAACREWRDFLDHGDGYISHLPIYVDGTCNGIQHFAAIARDPELARKVNLSPSEIPQDIYGAVAEAAMKKVRATAKTLHGRETYYAEMWVKALDASKMTFRSLAKLAVMTRPYGASVKTILDDVREKLRDDIDRAKLFISEEDEPKAAGFLGTRLKAALDGVLVKPEEMLEWLQACVVAVHTKGIKGREAGFEWTTPSGWPWGLMYGAKKKMKMIGARRGDARLQAGYQEFSDTDVDIKEQKKAASPNFIHALDASALVFAITILADSTPVSGVIAIHDAVGALAADVPHVNKAVREGFVELYSEHNPIQSIFEATLDQVRPEARHTVPAPPELGSFDIREVLRSPYFFS
jgi:DNA-directed RNA polymerase, mitochondrial